MSTITLLLVLLIVAILLLFVLDKVGRDTALILVFLSVIIYLLLAA